MKKRIVSLVLAGIIAACATTASFAAETAKGVVFTDESGYHASTYTGYIGARKDDTVGDLTAALVNSTGIKFSRGGTALAADAKLATGDTVSLGEKSFTVMVMGDVNADASVNLLDASAMMKKIAKWDSEINATASDVDGNGTVNLSDASTVLKIAANWDVDVVSKPVDPATKEKASGYNVITPFSGEPNTPLNLIKGDLALRFTVAEGESLINLISIYPSWANAIGRVTLGLYKWDTDYETTISAMPIFEDYVIDQPDDGRQITFDVVDTIGNGLGAGEYLWLLHEGVDDTPEPHGIGVWTGEASTEDIGVTVYYDGEVVDYGVKAWINTVKVK